MYDINKDLDFKDIINKGKLMESEVRFLCRKDEKGFMYALEEFEERLDNDDF